MKKLIKILPNVICIANESFSTLLNRTNGHLDKKKDLTQHSVHFALLIAVRDE